MELSNIRVSAGMDPNGDATAKRVISTQSDVGVVNTDMISVEVE